MSACAMLTVQVRLFPAPPLLTSGIVDAAVLMEWVECP